MCLSKYSNLEHLREVAMNLYLSKDHGNIVELSERDLAALIHTFYQDQESGVPLNGEKRNIEHEGSGNKKLKVFNKVFNVLSVLELLPNEVYEMILKNLSGYDKKNLRTTSIGLYQKTTLMAPMFHNWCFEASKGTQPDFVLNDDKNFCIKELQFSSVDDPSSNLMNRFSHRISNIEINKEGLLINYLNSCSRINSLTARFSNLKSLDLQNVYFDCNSLLMLAPQLENLGLAFLVNTDIDISSVDEDSKCFTKLKTLELKKIKVDVKKILKKCCNTLEYFEFEPAKHFEGLEDLDEELISLISLSIRFYCKESVKNLLSKCSGSLRVLNLTIDENVHLDSENLFDQTMKITTLVLDAENNQSNISMLFSKCPLIQNLSLKYYDKEVKDIVLVDLINLNLECCTGKCVTSILNQTCKSLKTLHLSMVCVNELANLEFPEISNLDSVRIVTDDEVLNPNEFDQVLKIFPADVKVTTQELFDATVLRRVYNLT